jgi:hypothetical protein
MRLLLPAFLGPGSTARKRGLPAGMTVLFANPIEQEPELPLRADSP